MEKRKVLLEVSDLKKWFPIKGGFFQKKGNIKAVDGVSLKVYQGETLGLVGESGCGKSTLARSILRLIEPTSGKVLFDGKDFTDMSHSEVNALRKDMQIIFQDPYGSLHPKMKIKTIIDAPMTIAHYGTQRERKERIRTLVEKVDLKPEHLERFPHEFSGGQRQRIVIARALATNPKLVICDEPVSALDVSVRSQILNLLKKLQQEMELTYLFISHDLSVVEHICDRVVVMYLGKIVESTTTKELFDNPLHPYTKALLSAVPQVYEENRRNRIILEGDVPSPANPPEGCHFRTRCPMATEICKTEPCLRNVGNEHYVACHYVKENEQ